MNKIILLLSIFFVLFSFSPSLYEIYHAKDVPPDRVFTLEHNYMFDFNFYLSRIKEGQEGRWTVIEKYYNQPHGGSLFQIFYLLSGKVGGVFGLTPTFIYHSLRLILGFIFLLLIGKYAQSLFSPKLSILAYLLVVTAGSWPILIKAENFWRLATYMGWWNVIDSLQRITFIPHVLLGQIFIVVFIWRFSQYRSLKLPKLLIWGLLGFIIGIVFPPTLIVIYTFFAFQSLLEIFIGKSEGNFKFSDWVKKRILPRFIFSLLSFPSLIYLKLMFGILPWSALALFDIQHRIPLDYAEYIRALGPVLPLGILGGIVAFIKRERKLLPMISWIISVAFLFKIFENFPEQAPIRFTEAAINIPLGVLACYLFYCLWQYISLLRRPIRQIGQISLISFVSVVLVMGILVMSSMVLWLTDQGRSKREGSWVVPTGTQLIYPLKDFMDGIYFLKQNSKIENVVLAYEAAGNYIPAYAGNYVYLGHANTPSEDQKMQIARVFFSGRMGKEGAREFLKTERISYIYFGPQEKDIGGAKDLISVYPFLSAIYKNNRVIVYKIN